MKQVTKWIIGLGSVALLLSCCQHQSPKVNTRPQCTVELARYMGTWHEIARLPNSFEEGLSRVTAHYRLMDNGRVAIRNIGYKDNGEKESIYGEAYVPHKRNSAHLRLSFVYPYRWFYSSYNILYVNEDYSLALVSGGSAGYLWLLARQSSISKTELELLLSHAQARGFNTAALIYPKTE